MTTHVETLAQALDSLAHAVRSGSRGVGRCLKALTAAESALAAYRAGQAQPSWTQADADEWGKRHDLKISGNDLFCAFEDAATLHLTRNG
jgi:hypothetical protein